jgi:hypothetical protein
MLLDLLCYKWHSMSQMLVIPHRFKKIGLHNLVVRRILSDILLVLGLKKGWETLVYNITSRFISRMHSFYRAVNSEGYRPHINTAKWTKTGFENDKKYTFYAFLTRWLPFRHNKNTAYHMLIESLNLTAPLSLGYVLLLVGERVSLIKLQVLFPTSSAHGESSG